MIKNIKELLNEIQRISHSLIFGDAYTAAYNNPQYKFFKQSLEKNGWKGKTCGLSCDEFKKFLNKTGYKVETKEFTAYNQISNNDIYESLKRRYFSSL